MSRVQEAAKSILNIQHSACTLAACQSSWASDQGRENTFFFSEPGSWPREVNPGEQSWVFFTSTKTLNIFLRPGGAWAYSLCSEGGSSSTELRRTSRNARPSQAPNQKPACLTGTGTSTAAVEAPSLHSCSKGGCISGGASQIPAESRLTGDRPV